MMFRRWPRRIPPAAPSGDIEKISWLGWPSENGLFIVKLVYVPKQSGWIRHDHDRLIFADIPARLFHTEMSVHLLLQERAMTAAELEVCRVPPEVLDFGRPRPEVAEMIRISKTELGPSAIIHEPFEIA